MIRVYPLSPSGAAADAVSFLGTREGLTVTDLTATPRFGLKGPGAADWFTAQGYALPAINHLCESNGATLLRLGGRDIMLIADPDTPAPVAAAAAAWRAAPQGYSSWREETWAWLRLAGERAEAVLSRLTDFDFRPSRFGPNMIAQTQVAHLDAVLIRCAGGFDLFFDIASTASVLRQIDMARSMAAPT